MNKRNLLLSVAAASAALVPASSFAAEGTITFAGTLVANTCSAVVNGGSSATATVTLPTTSVSSLTAAGQTAGDTAFTIVLKGTACTGTTTAYPYFLPTSTYVNTNGRLTDTNSATTKADVQLLTGTKTVINLASDASSQILSTATSTSATSITYPYYARYYALSATSAGAVSTSVDYSVIYK